MGVGTMASDSCPPRVLVIGSGAREHAICVALARSPQQPALLCFGSAQNPGIRGLCCEYTVGKLNDAAAISQFASAHKVGLAVVGPEAPLEAGATDALVAAGVAVVGPTQALAQIESSKAFALQLLKKYGMAGLPDFQEFTSLDGAREYLHKLGEGNYVIKADGLCGGKGVKVAGAHLASIEEALEYCAECLPRFVICEKLLGQEFSVLSFCDGDDLVHMPPVQDHKRAYEGDEGPNTGGMGSYSCADHLLPFLSAEALAEAHAMNKATVDALKKETGEAYRGVLYGGYMLTTKGTMLIEYNARLGDPECLNLLSLLSADTDFLAVCQAIGGGGLSRVPVRFEALASCCKYSVPEGYPNSPKKNFDVDMSAMKRPQLAYLGAVDEKNGGGLVATGSRTVGVVALAPTLDEAEAAAEEEVSAVKGELFHRKDIGTAPLVNQRVAHMLSLQSEACATPPVAIGVLGSTRGSSLQPVLRAIASGELRGVRIAAVLSNKADAPILERARQHGIAAEHVPVRCRSRDEYDAEISAKLEAAGVQVVMLVGFMRILSPAFCKRWRRRAINVHPSLLPAFAGKMDLEVHEAVLQAKVAETGCTVHMVDAEVDAGEVVCQEKTAVLQTDTAASLKARVQTLEGSALCKALAILAAEVGGKGGGALSYAAAGVDIDAGNALVERIKPIAKSTTRAGVLGSIGGFGGLFDLKAAGYDDPILVSATDGVGTKLIIAQQVGYHETIGIDLVAMVVNDLVVQGAEPLFFLDYFASGKLQVSEAEAVIKGIAEGCRESNCALIGGETAEMPNMYAPGHYDLAGFAVGAASRSALLPRLEAIGAGDVLIGLPSSGVHSNGFSLVRKVAEREGVAFTDAAPFDSSRSLGHALLTPTKLYVRSCLAATRSGKVKALAHITGGGLLENLPRVLPAGVQAVVDGSKWSPPPVFGWLAAGSRSGVIEMLRTFNCGIGMVIVVAQADADAVLSILQQQGEAPALIGSLAALEGEAEVVDVHGTEAWGWPAAAP